MNRHRVLLLVLLATAAVTAVIVRGRGGLPAIDDAVLANNRAVTVRRRAELHATGVYAVDSGWTPLAAPRPGEWLFDHPEDGQTFEEFVAFQPLRKAPGRERILLQPLAPLRPHAQAALEAVREQCARFFVAETALAAAIDTPADAHRPERGQHDAEALLNALAARRPPDLLVYAGVGDQDLCVRGLDNYVFGLGRFREGLGVYSFHRFWHPGVDEGLYLRRSFKLLTHELGHGFGLKHCIYYRCVMNGSNSLPETDGAPLEPCPVCLRKLRHSLGFDLAARWTALASLYDDLRLADEAAFVRARLAALQASGPPWRE